LMDRTFSASFLHASLTLPNQREKNKIKKNTQKMR